MNTFIEVCAGAGGLSTGFIKMGWKPLLLNDMDKDCCETLRLNHKQVRVECCSMDEIDLSEYVGKVGILMGGIPCQSFSHAGLRKGLEDDRGKLIYKFIKMITTLCPNIFLIENVKGLVTHNKGQTFNQVLNILRQCNEYNVIYKVLNAVNYNVPQKRERLFIIGLKKKANVEFKFPQPLQTTPVLKDVLKDVPISPCAKYSDNKISLFRQIPQGGC